MQWLNIFNFGAPSDVFSRHTGGDKDQKKEPNRVTYTCSIIKIHWIYSTDQNGWWQLGHIASVQMGSGVMQSCMRRQCAFMHHVADKDFWGWERVEVGASSLQTATRTLRLRSHRVPVFMLFRWSSQLSGFSMQHELAKLWFANKAKWTRESCINTDKCYATNLKNESSIHSLPIEDVYLQKCVANT